MTTPTPPPFPLPAGSPAKKKTSLAAKVLTGLVGAMILLVMMGMIFGPGTKTPASTPEADTTSSEPAKAVPAVEVYETTAVKLNQDYERNEVATDLKIGDRVVELTGQVQSIDKDFMDDVVVHLVAGNEFMPASMTMAKSETAKAAELSKGDIVLIRCEKMKRIMDTPAGSDCVLRGR